MPAGPSKHDRPVARAVDIQEVTILNQAAGNVRICHQMIVPWKRPPGKQSEVDDGENEVKAEELSVVPNVGEGELARDR